LVAVSCLDAAVPFWTPPEVTLLELLALTSVRHAAQLMKQPLPAVAADVRDERQLQQRS